MACELYTPKKFSAANQLLIDTMNSIVASYQQQGFRLTVRQLYYQLVARAVIPNTEQSYGRICAIVNDARLAGLIDWDAIEDRTRAFVRRARWGSGADIVNAAAKSFHMDMWANQNKRVYVIIEKEALVGVLEGLCYAYDVPLLAARGYPSATVVREFVLSDLLSSNMDETQDHIILHLGDHDPSGIDMTRDLQDRIELFSYADANIRLERIALNMDQIEAQQPPPNPAKVTDSRFRSYQQRFGDESWELDSLPPTYLNKLVRKHFDSHINAREWKARMQEIDSIRARLQDAAAQFEEQA